VERFHRLHEDLYSVRDEASAVEFTEWNVQAIGRLQNVSLPQSDGPAATPEPSSSRMAYFREAGGLVETPVYGSGVLPVDVPFEGPVIIDEKLTTIVVPPHATCRLTPHGSYVVDLQDQG
jgi:N-methylhydantoinase A